MNPTIHPREYLASASGRIFAATVGFALLGAGLLATLGLDAIHGIALVAVVLVASATYAIGLAVDRHPVEALLMVIAFPLLTGPYFLLLNAAVWFGEPVIGIPVMLLSAIPFWIAMRGSLPHLRSAGPSSSRKGTSPGRYPSTGASRAA